MSPQEPLTPRELVELGKFKQALDWDHTAMLRSDISAIMSKRTLPDELNPYKQNVEVSKENGKGLTIREAREFVERNCR